MILARSLRLVGLVAAVVSILAIAWPVNAQGTTPSTTGSRTMVAKLNDSGANVWIAGIMDADGYAAVAAISDSDAWNAQHAKWFRGQVVNGQFTGQSTDGATLTATHDGTQLMGTINGQPWSATMITGGTAGVYVGGNSQEVVALIEAPDGTRIGRVWSRATGQHVRTLTFAPASAGPSDSYSMLSVGSQGSAPGTVTVNPNGSRQVQYMDQTSNTSWCSSSFC